MTINYPLSKFLPDLAVKVKLVVVMHWWRWSGVKTIEIMSGLTRCRSSSVAHLFGNGRSQKRWFLPLIMATSYFDRSSPVSYDNSIVNNRTFSQLTCHYAALQHANAVSFILCSKAIETWATLILTSHEKTQSSRQCRRKLSPLSIKWISEDFPLLVKIIRKNWNLMSQVKKHLTILYSHPHKKGLYHHHLHLPVT